MKLKKCGSCGEYNLTSNCRECGKIVEEAHYKFKGLRDVGEVGKKC